ncbi:receptor-type tyrosine-protein phosphatase F-like, partial [Macrobrachium rosenbergii]|uniref:receptor-type tyrosine-protein phosphatase F-like n=1 Tax=Macrobrachium rosenbergii TaxID=79674 RepID=UPI0034D59F84
MATERVTVDNGESASLVCSALGNPTPNITWVRPFGEANLRRNNSSRGILATGLGEARLLVDWVSREDTGVYHCIASSVVSTSKPVASLIIVNQAPWSPATRQRNMVISADDNYWDADYGHGQSWAPEGGRGRLECRVRASPRPTFTWSTDTGQSIMTDTKYTIKEPRLVDGIVEWESVLEVKRVSHKDYINYTCTATNKEGLFSTILSLKPPATPDVPEHFTLVNVTSTTAMFVWKRQTDERKPEGYTIKYWTSGARDYKFLNISGVNISSAFIAGLSPGTDYYFTIQGYNTHGKSQFSSPPTLVMTLLGAAESAISSSTSNGLGGDDANSKVPRLILFIMTLAGTALLALNMAIIACFVRRRSHMNNNRA